MGRNPLKKLKRDFDLLFSAITGVLKLLYIASKKGHARGILKHLRRMVHKCLVDIAVFVEASKEFGDLDAPSIRALGQRVRGLHGLLPDHQKFHYSILVPVYRPHPDFFEKAVKSALNQSAPHCEVLLGLDGPQPEEVHRALKKLEAVANDMGRDLRIHSLEKRGGISNVTNALAKEARGNFLLLMDHDDWISPDLLFRYEQCLRLLRHPERTVLYCNEFKINERDEPVLDSYLSKPQHPVFPYVFVNWICHCLLVPKNQWEKVGGLRPECDGAQDYDLCLRLDAEGAQFQNVPFYLYAWRAHAQSTAENTQSKTYAHGSGIRALKDYVVKKSLDWEITDGYLNTVYRAIPQVKINHTVHVVMPYKDQKAMTLQAAKSVFLQSLPPGLTIRMTAVDNRSQDDSIRVELERLGIEVLEVNEAFNYSRINNFAVQSSRYAATSDCILFLNNDVELNSGALEEMVRWVDQPQVGMVGARLHFPNRAIQHGGVMLNSQSSFERMHWNHMDVNQLFENAGFSKITGVCDAVTAACLLIKREIFLRVKGFDEIWYPIAFSDTDLATKVRRLGLYSLYTPYATGTHFESASRGPGVHEIPEGSYWLFRMTRHRDELQKQLGHSIF